MASFAGAPVSKGEQTAYHLSPAILLLAHCSTGPVALIVGLGGATLLAAATSRQYLFNVPLYLLTRDLQLWRLMAHHLVFGNSSELFVGVLLLFYTSVPVERAFGSLKYGVSDARRRVGLATS